MDAVTKAHSGDVTMVEDVKFHKLILIGMASAAKDVDAEDVVHRMALALE